MISHFSLRTLVITGVAIISPALAATGQSLVATTTSEDDKINVAVLTLKNAEGVTAGESEIISDRLRAELFSTGRVNIMERDQMQSVLKEQGFQQSGACTDEACMVEIGKLLGVKQLVTGSIGKLGSIFLVNIRVIDVSTGKIIRVLSRDLNGMDVVVGHLPGISRELVGVDQRQAGNTRDVEARPAPKPVVAAPRPAPAPAPAPKPVMRDETKTAPAAVAEPAAETATLSGTGSKNKNRGGIHLGYNFYIGETWVIASDSEQVNDTLNMSVERVMRRPVQQPHLNFIIPLGQYMTMDLGFGFAYWRENLTGVRTGDSVPIITGGADPKPDSSAYFNNEPGVYPDLINTLYLQHLSVPVMAGLNIVIRAYPIKITFGPTFSYNPMWVMYFGSDSMDVAVNGGLPVHTAFTYALTLGAKAGIEIMLGSHVGMGGDFLFRPSLVRPTYEYHGWTITERMPMFGAGANINFYF